MSNGPTAVSSSSAADTHKAVELLRLYVKAGAEVHVVMTRSAQEFVTPLTFQTLSGNRAEDWHLLTSAAFISMALPLLVAARRHLPESKRFIAPHGDARLKGHGGRLRLLAAAASTGGRQVTSEWAATRLEYETLLARARCG